jgi:hypothetical protein
MTQNDTLSGRCNRQISQVDTCLSGTKDDNRLVSTEFISGLEVGRVLDDRDTLNARHIGDARRHMQTRANGHGVTFPGQLFPVFPVMDDMAGRVSCPPTDRENRGGEIDGGPEIKVVAVLLQIFDVSLGGEKIRILLAGAEVGKCSELLRRHQLGVFVCPVGEGASDGSFGLEEQRLYRLDIQEMMCIFEVFKGNQPRRASADDGHAHFRRK